MKCYYELLGVSVDCTADDLKKSYRKLALTWHPDKNLDNLEEATETFRLIQQAYEVLIDPQERAWYDRHKEDILRGDAEEPYKDNCVNVFQYFTASCFKGYNDEEKGFYTVYRKVFEEITSEDRPFMEEEIEVPQFGCSTYPFDEVVKPFYAYWQDYCTFKTYSWEDKYNICDARRSGAGRSILRAMEKENKKLRDQNRKIRNEEVRELVAFVRKRDKRIQAHKKLMEEKRLEKEKLQKEQRKKQLLKRNKSLETYVENDWNSKSQFEAEFTALENSVANTFGDDTSNSAGEEESLSADMELYCAACEKDFRSEKALQNHNNSKKHKENVVLLQYLMEEEELEWASSNQNESESLPDNNINAEEATKDDAIEESGDEEMPSSEAMLDELIKRNAKSKKKKKKNKTVELDPVDNICGQIASLQVEKPSEETQYEEKEEEKTSEEANSIKKAPSKKKKPRRGETKSNKDECSAEAEEDSSSMSKDPLNTLCDVCNKDFNSRNKLFQHLKESGHAVYKSGNDTKSSSKSKGKKRRQ